MKKPSLIKVNLMTYADVEFAKKNKIYEAGSIIVRSISSEGTMSYLDKPQTVDVSYFVLKPKNILPKYLFYILINELDYILYKYQNGINLQSDAFKYIEIYICKNEEYQQKVVEILEKVDKAIEKTEKTIEKTKKIKEYHMANMFI